MKESNEEWKQSKAAGKKCKLLPRLEIIGIFTWITSAAWAASMCARLCVCICVCVCICICISASLLTGIFGAWLNRIARRLINIKRSSLLPLACLLPCPLPLVEWIRSLCEWIIENIYRVHCSNFNVIGVAAAACNLVFFSSVVTLLISYLNFNKIAAYYPLLCLVLSRLKREQLSLFSFLLFKALYIYLLSVWKVSLRSRQI